MRGYRPTRKQKQLIEKSRLKVANWLVVTDTAAELKLLNKTSQKVRVIKKQ